MFHLSKELTGVLLPHDTYGTHLDNNGQTVDVELELKNFEAAGTTLCNIWNNLVIDGYQTFAEFIKEPPPQSIKDFVATPEFRSKHVFETQYMTVYLKCRDNSCCEPFVTNAEAFFPHRNIPPLIPIKKTEVGVVAIEKSGATEKVEFLPISQRVMFGDTLVPQSEAEKYPGSVPYDLYLPSVQDKLLKRVCKKCGKYHATQKSLTVHRKVCKAKAKRQPKRKARTQRIESSDEDDEVEEPCEITEVGAVGEGEMAIDVEEDDADEYLQASNVMDQRPKFSVTFQGQFVEKIMDIKEWLKSPWVEDNDYNNND